MDYDQRPYRLCAGIMLVNKDNKVFVGQRIDNPQPCLQMPQGGIDEGESPQQAALRELLEEIGTNKAEIIGHYPTPLEYDLPRHLADITWKGLYRGQRQYWFFMRFLGEDSDINLQTDHPEFNHYKWVALDELPDYAISFKKRDLPKTGRRI